LATANVIPQALAITLWAQLVQLSQMGIDANAGALEGLEIAHLRAKVYAQQLATQRDRHIARANLFQVKGVRP
jgi:hypothetical protein